MDTRELADHLAEPIGTVGMSYYFSPQAIARGEAFGMDVVTFYAGGRGGVLGDRTPAEVDDIFFFFKSGMVAAMVEKARSIRPADETAAEHLKAADDFAHATFGAIDPAVLDAFSAAAGRLMDAVPEGTGALVDGYRHQAVPHNPYDKACYWSIVLRELRGAVHTNAVHAAGMSGAEACQLDRDGAFFALHGYGDDDRAEETADLIARRNEVEVETSAAMAKFLDGLDEDDRQALLAGARAMFAALADPVAVTA
jgi:hypothetical protein